MEDDGLETPDGFVKYPITLDRGKVEYEYLIDMLKTAKENDCFIDAKGNEWKIILEAELDFDDLEGDCRRLQSLKYKKGKKVYGRFYDPWEWDMISIPGLKKVFDEQKNREISTDR